MTRSVTMKTARNRNIEINKDVAMIWLNQFSHKVGQPVIVRYYDENDSIDCIYAMGIKNGIGPDCYSVVSPKTCDIIWGVVTQAPDISSLVNGEIFLYYNITSDTWNLVYIKEDSRIIQELSEKPEMYFNISDDSIWVTKDRRARQLNDIYSKEEIDRFVEEAKDTVRYVSFDDITPEQREQIKGDPGEQGEKGDPFRYEDFTREQLEGLRGPRGFNGSVLNFVVLTEEEYNNILPIDLDPEKFYYIYEDTQPTPGEFYAYVEGDILYISADFLDPETMSINPGNTSVSDDILTLIQGGSTLIVATPLLERYGGTYTESFILTITCPTEGALIRYTTDGSEPTEMSEIYDSTTGLLINRTMTLKVIATKVGYESSGVVIANYTISEPEPGKVDIPEFLQPEGEYINRVTTAIHTSTEGATIYYTLNGTEPTKNSLEYSPGTLLTFESTTTLKAKAYKDSMNPSDPATATYVIRESQGVFIDGDILNDDTGSYDSYKWIINTTATVNNDVLEFI